VLAEFRRVSSELTRKVSAAPLAVQAERSTPERVEVHIEAPRRRTIPPVPGVAAAAPPQAGPTTSTPIAPMSLAAPPASVLEAPTFDDGTETSLDPGAPGPSSVTLAEGQLPGTRIAGLEDELLVERLTDQIRANPGDRVAASALVDLLARLGRDLDLLALLSARMEEGDAAVRQELAPRRREVLARLAARARAEGRASEAELYEMILEAEPPG
jgi:hypothetical protein